MSTENKIVEKLQKTPQNLKYSEIETLFQNEKYKIEKRKGSHIKISYIDDETLFVVIPLHGNDCIDVYKTKLKKFYNLTKTLWKKD